MTIHDLFNHFIPALLFAMHIRDGTVNQRVTSQDRFIFSVSLGDHLATFSAMRLGKCTFDGNNQLMPILFDIYHFNIGDI